MDTALWLSVTIVLSFAVYFPVGVLLVKRRRLRPIISRSPLMLAIAHWANFVDLALLYEFMFKFYDQKATFSSYYTSITLTCHYLYYFPYLLRCYRLRFVFKLDKNWESTYFRDNIKRAKQRWQLLALCLLMVPVLIVAAFLAALPEQNVFIPESVQSDSSNERTEMVYIFVCFLEQVLFIVAVFQLRRVSDDYKMTLELTIVCCLWLCNSAFSRYSASSWWLYECAARNWAMMLVSSLWPVLKSFRKGSFQEMITPEVANSLELVLQNEFTLDCFEAYLCCCEWLAEEKQCLPPDDILRFWLQCEILRTDESPDLADSIRKKYAKFLQYAAGEPSSTGSLVEKLGYSKNSFLLAQRVAFARLKEYFSLFQRSLVYSKMMREVTRQEIYANRLFMTSMHGADK